MNAFYHHHPVICIVAFLALGAALGVLYIWRALGGRFLP